MTDTHLLLGETLRRQGKTDESIVVYQNALAINPYDAEAYHQLGMTFRSQGRLEIAIGYYQQALILQPGNGRVLSNLGTALGQQGALDQGICCLQRALVLQRDLAETHYNLGYAYHLQGKLDEAVACFKQATIFKPDCAEAYYNTGCVLYSQVKPDQALPPYQRASVLRPHYADAHSNVGLCQLLMGDFARGWEEHEWRWRSTGTAHLGARPEPLWLGQVPLFGKRILLWDEQGYGDSLQFVRYARLVVPLADQVVLEVQPTLKRLMQISFGDRLQVIARGEPVPACEVQTPFMSLPLAFQTTLETIPAFLSYLKPDPEEGLRWAALLKAYPGVKVGLVWAGGVSPPLPWKQAMNTRRSLPLSAFARFADLPGCHFFSLQKGPPAAQWPALRQAGWPGPELLDFTDQLHDWADTAALVSQLDLVLSCDTSTAHLAAALGKPTWILNRYDTCWRWLLQREDSPWYPSVRLFRQPRPGHWHAVLDRVFDQLRALTTAKEDSGRRS